MTPSSSRPYRASDPLRRRGLRAVRAVVALGVIAASTTYWLSSAGAVDVTGSVRVIHGSIGGVDLTPSPAASNTGTVSITVAGMTHATDGALNGSGIAAASLCGNFAANGTTPLTAAEQGANNCDGGADIAQVVFLDPSAGTVTFSKTLRQSGIGLANSQCLPGGMTPCVISVGTSYDSAAGFAIQIPVFGGGGTTTTTELPSEPPATGTTGGESTTTTTATTVPTPSTSVATTTTAPPPTKPSLAVTPAKDLVGGQMLKVEATGLGAFEGETFAVSQCGNAASSGAALGGVLEGNCYGGDGLGNGQLKFVTVTGGRVAAEYPVATGPIGANKAICTPAVADPCRIMVADVASAGTVVRLEVPISLRSEAVVSNAGGDAGPGTGGQPGASGTGPVAAAVSTGTLPYTGGPSPWTLIAVGVALLDLGWLAAGLARPARPRR